MKKLTWGGLLVVLAVFMLVGFLNADVDPYSPAVVAALVITVGLPVLGAGALFYSHLTGKGARTEQKERLRAETLEAEVLRLAERREGKLTAVEVVGELAVSKEAAEGALKSLARRELADIEVSESGLLVYAFPDVQKLGEKSDADRLLDA